MGNIATTVDNVTFGSGKEARRYGELKLMLLAGEITNLELQPCFQLVINGVKVGRYTADFQYYEVVSPTRSDLVIEEVKGYRVRDYPLRSKVFKALHPHIKFIET